MSKEVGAVVSGMMAFGGVLSNPVVLGILSVLVALTIMYYLKWTKEKNNPYLLLDLLRMVPSRNKIKVFYFRENGGNLMFDGWETGITGSKGVYLPRIDKVLNIDDRLILGSNPKALFYKLTTPSTGYPMEFFRVGHLLNKEKTPLTKEGFTLLEGAQHRQTLFLEQHFSAIINQLQTIYDRGKNGWQRLMEAAPFVTLGILVLGGYIMLYMFSSKTIQYNSQMSAESVKGIQELYKGMYDRNQYCATIIAKYGTKAEQDYYNSLPTPDWDKINQTVSGGG